MLGKFLICDPQERIKFENPAYVSASSVVQLLCHYYFLHKNNFSKEKKKTGLKMTKQKTVLNIYNHW